MFTMFIRLKNIYIVSPQLFKLYINDLDVTEFCSQGQQRLVSLSMKLAVAEIISKANKEEPIIILDDAFSELDKQKKTKLN